jgi:STAS domain
MATRAPTPVTFTVDVQGVDLDAVTVDALARLQLAAGRFSCRLVLRNAAPELLELVEFMGLAEVLMVDRFGLGVEPRRQSEERE